MEIRLPYTKSNWCVVVYTNSIFGLWEILHKTAGRKKVVEISSSKKKYAYITKPNEPVLYYLRDGPQRGFVREELLIVPFDTQLPP